MKKRMKRSSRIKLWCAVVLLILLSGYTAISVNAWGNKSMFDTSQTFNKAIINTFDGPITVDVKKLG